MTLMCPIVELSYNSRAELSFIETEYFLDQNQKQPLVWIGPNKYIDENLALNFSDCSEAWSFKTRKSHGLSLS